MAEVEHVLEVHNVIGEGPVWHSQEGFLYWVNFIGQYQILRFSPQTRRVEVFETGMPVMALGIRKTGGFIAATSKGIANWDMQRGSFEPFCDPLAGRTGVRFNDAATDSQGRVLGGHLHEANAKGPDGELYCIQGSDSCQLMDKKIHVA